MQGKYARFALGPVAAMGALLVASGLAMTGCTAAVTAPSGSITTSTVSVPVTITDAPSDQVLAASLTLNSVALTDAKGGTASILPGPLTFEAAHLDSVQEPLFTPAIPQDTYVSISLTYSNAQVAYIDPTTKQLAVTTATLANTSQVIKFATPITVNNATTSLLIDYLVANSVSITGSTVTVTPQFHVVQAPIAAQPTNGTNGLQCGIKGKVAALGTNQFTLMNPAGISIVINVNGNTQYQGLSGFSALAVGALVEVDVEFQTTGSVVALRVEEQVAPNATGQLLVGPVVAVTGSPATSFTQLTRQAIGPTPVSTPVAKNTIAITGSTQFLLPGRWNNIGGGSPFTPTFNPSTLFAGQVVGVATNNLSNNAATAAAVILTPQTVAGTITGALAPTCSSCWGQFTLTLPSGSWLATITGQTTVLVLVPSGKMQAVYTAAPTVSQMVRFNGFLFNNNGTLTLVAVVEGPPPGTAIGPTPF